MDKIGDLHRRLKLLRKENDKVVRMRKDQFHNHIQLHYSWQRLPTGQQQQMYQTYRINDQQMYDQVRMDVERIGLYYANDPDFVCIRYQLRGKMKYFDKCSYVYRGESLDLIVNVLFNDGMW